MHTHVGGCVCLHAYECVYLCVVQIGVEGFGPRRGREEDLEVERNKMIGWDGRLNKRRKEGRLPSLC